jgi:O-antigen/teichoic acid export membrane protein
LNLRRNTAYGAIGFLVPTVVLVVAYPIVLRHLGTQAMGLYLLASTVSGSLAFLEFGVSTATVKILAEQAATGDRHEAGDVVATSLAFYGALGAIGSVAFWILAPVMGKWAGVDAALEPDAVRVIRIVALQFVPAYAIGVFSSVFKGLHRFAGSTLLASLHSTLTWGGAVIGLEIGGIGVVGVAWTSLAATLVVFVLSAGLVWRTGRETGIDLLRARPRRSTLRGLLRFGVFMAVNGVAGVLMQQVQTWIIAAFLGAGAVTVFSTALQVTTKINGLMGAMFEPMMPVAAALTGRPTPAGLRALRVAYNKAMAASVVLSTGGAAVLYLVSPWLISLWLRSSIDGQVTAIIRILCVGLAVNGVTPIAFHLVNGIGRPGTNTAFMVAGIVLFYGILAGAWASGLTVEKFAMALSVTFVLNGAAYLAFSELVVWRRWLVWRESPAERSV